MHILSRLLKVFSIICTAVTIAVILFLFGYVFLRGASSINLSFLTESPSGSVLGSEGGILPAIQGSLCYTLIAVITAFIPAVSCALYLVYYHENSHFGTFLRVILQCISGIPSIVFGLFGYSFLVIYMGFGRSILSGGITLGLMIIPFIEVRIENAMRTIPGDIIFQSDSLGVSRFYMIRHVIFPIVWQEIISAFLLGGCYAMGAAAPLIFTGAVINAPSKMGLLSPAMALPNHLHSLLTQGISKDNAYGTAFVLMAIVLVVNLAATFHRPRFNKK